MADPDTKDLLSIAAEGTSPRKIAVLNAAITLFAERGFEGVSVRDIGEYLNQTGPSIYRHYKSKSDVLADAVAMVILPMIKALREIVEAPESAPERLEEAIYFHASFALRHRVYLRVYYRDAGYLSDADRRLHRRRTTTYRDLWTTLLLESGVADEVDEAGILYGMLMAMMNVGVPLDPAWPEDRLLGLIVGRAKAMLINESE
jgi:AcrR family transcriptional regulator